MKYYLYIDIDYNDCISKNIYISYVIYNKDGIITYDNNFRKPFNQIYLMFSIFFIDESLDIELTAEFKLIKGRVRTCNGDLADCFISRLETSLDLQSMKAILSMQNDDYNINFCNLFFNNLDVYYKNENSKIIMLSLLNIMSFTKVSYILDIDSDGSAKDYFDIKINI